MRKILSALLLGLTMLAGTSALAAAPVKTWTFLIYINGNNNLDHFGKQNIKDMEKVGSNDQVNIVVEWASLSARKTVRMLIQKSANGDVVSSPVIENLGKVDMGDYHTLQDFIAWGVKNYPAEHYFVDVWNHGSGWHALKNSRTAKNASFRSNFDISWDDNSGHSITTEQLGLTMTKAAEVIGHKVDIYASDACLMAMGEVAAEMSDSVSFYAGSEETEPGTGWPYADLLSGWEATAKATPEQVVKILTDTYVKSYQSGSNGSDEVTFSAYDLSQLPAFHQAMADFGTNLRLLTPVERKAVSRASSDTQRFTFSDYADLLDFVKHLAAANIKGIDTKVLAALQATAGKLIIANAATSQFESATGLTIWIPQSTWSYKQNSARYKGMKFDVATHWGDTLEALLQGASSSDPSEPGVPGEPGNDPDNDRSSKS